ncbi:MAG: hypothetical protein HXY18_13835 [Bryobacteraceae bacterium]|nr:hypothetical protein [Bryobacteraceae bacterium]
MSPDKSKVHPVPVMRAPRKFGHNMRDARRRRRIPSSVLAERAGIGRMTLIRIERGDGSVSMAGYAAALYSLGMIEPLGDIADPRFDAIGREIEEEHLPQRIRLRRPKPKDDR